MFLYLQFSISITSVCERCHTSMVLTDGSCFFCLIHLITRSIFFSHSVSRSIRQTFDYFAFSSFKLDLRFSFAKSYATVGSIKLRFHADLKFKGSVTLCRISGNCLAHCQASNISGIGKCCSLFASSGNCSCFSCLCCCISF